jgi:hypothetical protein
MKHRRCWASPHNSPRSHHHLKHFVSVEHDSSTRAGKTPCNPSGGVRAATGPRQTRELCGHFPQPSLVAAGPYWYGEWELGPMPGERALLPERRLTAWALCSSTSGARRCSVACTFSPVRSRVRVQ